MALIKKKICLLGSFAVGKTSLIERFVYNRFDDKYLTTIGVKISEKILPPIRKSTGGKTVQHAFLIWDIAGLAKFNQVAHNYFRGASAALAVADLTRVETIEDLRIICDQFLSVNPGAKIVFIGNKLDIFQKDQKIIDTLQEAAAAFSTKYITTSAKTGQRVEDAFYNLSTMIET